MSASLFIHRLLLDLPTTRTPAQAPSHPSGDKITLMTTTNDPAYTEDELHAWIDWLVDRLMDPQVQKMLLMLLVIGAGTVVMEALRLFFFIVRLLFKIVVVLLRVRLHRGRRGHVCGRIRSVHENNPTLDRLSTEHYRALGF